MDDWREVDATQAKFVRCLWRYRLRDSRRILIFVFLTTQRRLLAPPETC